MLSKADLKRIIEQAEEFNVSEIYLFGSMVNNPENANDIDLAVRGLEPALFFKFYGNLLGYLSRPVDLVDLSQKTLLNKLILENAVKIYGKFGR